MEYKNRFNEFLQTALNKAQQEAVDATDGSILVIAGAGSGKTRVITCRISNLILNKSVEPTSIVALTFTNKAAREMQERIKHFLGISNERNLPFIGTFHSYCLRLLKMNQELLDTPFFTILDSDDQHKILNGIIIRNNLQKLTAPKQLSYQISNLKNNALDPEFAKSQFMMHPLLEQMYHAYEAEKRASKCLDFDDLLLETLKIFRTKPEFKKDFQERVRHILVDEYQDTNTVQHEFLKQMSKDSKHNFAIDSICVVGDEDQSIYSWRGATIANIINFKKDFPQTVTVKIEQNYRSVQPILDVANNVIQHNKQRNPKKLWSEKKGEDRIRLLTCMTEYQEGDVIAALAQSMSTKQKLSSIAVLYRTHFQSRAIEEALIKNSIAYRIIGGVQFYERKEIKDILAYLKLVLNPFDRASFMRVINVPLRGLGAKFEELFYERWHNEAFLTFHDIAKKLIEEGHVVGNKKTTLQEFIQLFDGLKPTDSPSKTVDHFISDLTYLKYLKDSYDLEDAQQRIDNIHELVHAIKFFEATKANTIEAFLDDIALMQEKISKNSENQDAIILMTLHAAKGLEFDTVVLAGLEDGLLPSSRSMSELASLEEERRLFYVGITRAKERLLLCRSRYRYAYKSMADQLPSRFLQEIPKNLVTQDDCSYFKTPEIKQYFNLWFGAVKRPASNVMTFGKSHTSSIKPAQSKESFSFSKSSIISSSPSKPLSPTQTKHGLFKTNQPVHHSKFGTGIVKMIEVKDDTTIYVTVDFKGTKKKVSSLFLKPV